jgi:O-antigen/teichoic acid export membrane protein
MKPNNWSMSGIAFGILFSLFSAIRYFLLYPDLDKAIVYVLIGAIIIGLAWLYDQMLRIRNRFDYFEDWMQDKFENKQIKL